MSGSVVKIARCDCGQMVTLLQRPDDPPVCHECRRKRMEEELTVNVVLDTTLTIHWENVSLLLSPKEWESCRKDSLRLARWLLRHTETADHIDVDVFEIAGEL